MFDKLCEYGVVPVVAVDSVDDGMRLCEALIAGGLPVAEVTFRTAAAADVIREARVRFPEMIPPGICTPSDVERAVELGCKLLKFFPAEVSGGVPMLKALIGPYGHLGIAFCPTGGVTTANLKDYLALPQVAFVGGTWIAKKDLIKAGDWAGITALAKAAVAAAKR